MNMVQNLFLKVTETPINRTDIVRTVVSFHFRSNTRLCLQLHSPFWCSTQLTGPSGEFKPLDPTDGKYNFENSQLLKYEAEKMRQLIIEGNLCIS